METNIHLFIFVCTMEPMRLEPRTSCILLKPITTRPILMA